jgi:hypothetical protein
MVSEPFSARNISMAFATSSSGLSASLSLAAFLPPVTEKLHRANHQSWKAQMLSALRGAQLADWLEINAEPPAKFLPVEAGKDADLPKPNPEYGTWAAKDQMVLSYILTNLSKEVLGHINTEHVRLTVARQDHHHPHGFGQCHKRYLYDQ